MPLSGSRREIAVSEIDPQVHRYVSMLALGGAVADKGPRETAFFYREKGFVMQFQAWWSEPEDRESPEYEERKKKYIQWVTNFRRHLEQVEGAFINFPDVPSLDPLRGFLLQSLDQI